MNALPAFGMRRFVCQSDVIGVAEQPRHAHVIQRRALLTEHIGIMKERDRDRHLSAHRAFDRRKE